MLLWTDTAGRTLFLVWFAIMQMMKDATMKPQNDDSYDWRNAQSAFRKEHKQWCSSPKHLNFWKG